MNLFRSSDKVDHLDKQTMVQAYDNDLISDSGEKILLKYFLVLTALIWLASIGQIQAETDGNSVERVLDSFHQAASDANGKLYFNLIDDAGVFIGTDGTERWNKEQFKTFALPYFEAGKGWTYLARDRHVQYSKDGKTAWFDEMLDNQNYGECRGTGVLVKTDSGWKIVQYH